MEIIVVDKKDTELCTKDIDQVDWEYEIYRAAAMWLYNDQGEVLIAQRRPDAHVYPSAWGPSAAGMLETGETYFTNAIKETAEEIGITLAPEAVSNGPKVYLENEDPPRHYFMQTHFAFWQGDPGSLTLQPDEVAKVRWINKAALLQEMQTHPDHYCDVVPEVIHKIPERI